MTDAQTIHVAQLSDTHFLGEGETAEGGFAYDTNAAFEAVLASMAGEQFDLVTVTGDVADHGLPHQYRVAADALGRIDAPINVCPGNHDQDVAFTAGMGRPKIGTSRAIEVGAWCFLFVDSNAGVMQPDAAGRAVDPDYEDRLHSNGSLGEAEAAWIRAMHDATTAEHVFVWVHHPPHPGIGMILGPEYGAEWEALVPSLPKLRGIGAGHTHVPTDYHFGTVPVFIAPALKNNFDLEAKTMLPPGYRRYAFAADGTVTSNLELADDDRWPRFPMSRLVVALFNGEVTWDEFHAVVARKQAEAAAAAES